VPPEGAFNVARSTERHDRGTADEEKKFFKPFYWGKTSSGCQDMSKRESLSAPDVSWEG